MSDAAASSGKEFTYADVSSHATKKDLYVVIHDKVYNSTSFVDEHPGGEEVLLDVAGQDASEAFEDVGHSDEAREILEGLLIGKLKRQAGDPAPTAKAPAKTNFATASSDGASMGVGLYAIILLGGAAAYAAYTYFQNQQGAQKV